MPPLAHCIYASAAAQPLDAAVPARMLEASRANNRRLGITGMLLYADGSFFQVLEGPSPPSRRCSRASPTTRAIGSSRRSSTSPSFAAASASGRWDSRRASTCARFPASTTAWATAAASSASSPAVPAN
ncbi:MAG: BLUF domain-containing protein [Comamonadaceae bacterium]|nr:BLUF domain-containing protein [Comamonadaceae bacterium]